MISHTAEHDLGAHLRRCYVAQDASNPPADLAGPVESMRSNWSRSIAQWYIADMGFAYPMIRRGEGGAARELAHPAPKRREGVRSDA